MESFKIAVVLVCAVSVAHGAITAISSPTGKDQTVTVTETGTTFITVAGTTDATSITYSISSQTPAEWFQIDGSTGVVTLQCGRILDFETTGTTPYVLNVLLTDDGGATDSGTVTISITNANEAPVFESTSYCATVSSSATSGTLGTYSATDPDASSAAPTYTFATACAFFTMTSGSTGGVVTKSSTAFESGTTGNFYLTLAATDASSAAGNAILTIMVDGTCPSSGAPPLYTGTAMALGTILLLLLSKLL